MTSCSKLLKVRTGWLSVRSLRPCSWSLHTRRRMFTTLSFLTLSRKVKIPLDHSSWDYSHQRFVIWFSFLTQSIRNSKANGTKELTVVVEFTKTVVTISSGVRIPSTLWTYRDLPTSRSSLESWEERSSSRVTLESSWQKLTHQLPLLLQTWSAKERKERWLISSRHLLHQSTLEACHMLNHSEALRPRVRRRALTSFQNLSHQRYPCRHWWNVNSQFNPTNGIKRPTTGRTKPLVSTHIILLHKDLSLSCHPQRTKTTSHRSPFKFSAVVPLRSASLRTQGTKSSLANGKPGLLEDAISTTRSTNRSKTTSLGLRTPSTSWSSRPSSQLKSRSRSADPRRLGRRR